MLVIIVVYYGHFATEVAKIVAKSEAFCNHFATRETQCDSAERGERSLVTLQLLSISFHRSCRSPACYCIVHNTPSYDPAVAKCIV